MAQLRDFESKIALVTGGGSGLVAVWLCSDAPSYVSGETMLVDGACVCR